MHFIPALLAYLFLIEFFFLSNTEKISVFKNQGKGYQTYVEVLLVALIVSGFTYVLLSFLELRKYKTRIREEFSNTEKINLNWLRYLIYSILVIWLVILLNGDDNLIFSAVVVFVLCLGYFGIRHTGIFSYAGNLVKDNKSQFIEDDIPATTEIVQDPLPSGKVTIIKNIGASPAKYEKSSLQKETAQKIYRDLLELMETRKVFKNEELSLRELAVSLGVHPNNLSQVINTYEGKSFYDYINKLRIEEFKKLVLKPENSRYTLLSLAYEAGFNSKTSFNRNFKKFTGQSPTAYLHDVNVKLVTE